MKTKLTEEQKKAAAEAIREGVQEGIAATQGKNLAWWERALWIAGLVAASVVSALFGASCTQAQVREVGHVAHAIYHADTGKPCVFAQIQEEGK